MKQKGQSILEIIITLSVLSLVLGGLVIVVVNGLKNSQFSKNQSIATKLAEEGLDTVRSMKSKEQCSVMFGATAYYWINKPSAQLIWSQAQFSAPLAPTTYNLDPTSCNLNISTPELIPNNSNFKRQITLEKDGSSNRLKVTSIVSWNDISGPHQSKLFTILSP